MTATCHRLALLFVLVGGGCQRPAAPPAPSAEKPRVESELARTTISRQAQESLGIKTVAVRIEAVQEYRRLSGWIMARPGSESTITAPVGGYLRAPAGPTSFPAPGQTVTVKQELFRLEPVFSPLEQTQLAGLRLGVEGDLAKARESLLLATSEMKRVHELAQQKLRAERDVEQAQTQVKLAQADLSAAEDKLKVFNPAGKPALLPLVSPQAGVLLTVPATPGQYVPAAAPLATIADLTRPRVRVPLPEHDLANVDPRQSILVAVGRQNLSAKPVAQVPQIDPIRHTADLLYELDAKAEQHFAKEEMVAVQLPLGQRVEASVVPYGAVIYDGYGGTWVYLDRTPADAAQASYERVRVELGAPVGEAVVVRPLLKAGERVVSEGAAALFSREFYRPPVATPESKAKGKQP